MIDTDEMMAISVNDANIILLLIPNARTTYCTTRTFHLFPREKIEFSKGTYHGRRVKFASKTCDYMIVGEEAYLLRSSEVCVRPLHHFRRDVDTRWRCEAANCCTTTCEYDNKGNEGHAIIIAVSFFVRCWSSQVRSLSLFDKEASTASWWMRTPLAGV